MTKSAAKLSGAALALAAAGVLAGCSSSMTHETAQLSTTDSVHCYGVNSCKGHNDCAGANNACKGQGSCKGLGFLSMSSQECADKGGTVKG